MNSACYPRLSILALGAAVSSTGCIPPWLFIDDDCPDCESSGQDFDPPDNQDNPVGVAPELTVNIADWPPVGANTVVQAAGSSPNLLEKITFEFRNLYTQPLFFNEFVVEATGADLGEGFGTLVVTLYDIRGGWTETTVSNFLVDMTPPEFTLGSTVLRPDGDLEVWVADAWVLGGVELEIDSIKVAHSFDAGYPPSLGEQWHTSLVRLNTGAFPEGHHDASITVTDAAGNATTSTIELVIDGTPPSIAIASPAPQAVLSGQTSVTIDAVDEDGGPVWMYVYLGGALVGSLTGPSAELLFDAGSFPAGDYELKAFAIDHAGNQSETVSIPVSVL